MLDGVDRQSRWIIYNFDIFFTSFFCGFFAIIKNKNKNKNKNSENVNFNITIISLPLKLNIIKKFTKQNTPKNTFEYLTQNQNGEKIPLIFTASL